MEILQKVFTYKLHPSRFTQQLFNRCAGSTRYIYNYGLALLKHALETEKKLLSYTDIASRLPALKKQQETSWLKEIPSQILQQALKDLESGMKHFYRQLRKKEKPGFPKFKRRGQKDSFRYPQGIKINGNAVFLPKIGWVNFTNTRPIEGTIKQATIKRDGPQWLIHIACAVPVEIVYAPLSEDRAVGIDLGLLSFAHMSDGTVTDNPRFLKHEIKQLRYLQRSFARKQKGSSNRKKVLAKIAQLHRKIRNKRKDFLHKLSTAVVKNHDVIAVEDLHVKGMIKNRRLSRSIADVGWSSFLQYLEYKCHWQGKHFVRVDRFLPSSKICSSCSTKKDMPLKLRTYTCSLCSLVIDRDLNASKNTRLLRCNLAAGISALKTLIITHILVYLKI